MSLRERAGLLHKGTGLTALFGVLLLSISRAAYTLENHILTCRIVADALPVKLRISVRLQYCLVGCPHAQPAIKFSFRLNKAVYPERCRKVDLECPTSKSILDQAAVMYKGITKADGC